MFSEYPWLTAFSGVTDIVIWLSTVIFLFYWYRKGKSKKDEIRSRGDFVISEYGKNIRPFVQAEYGKALQARNDNDPSLEFRHLENAHVLGQASTFIHIKTHCLMWMWGFRQGNLNELLGQIFRIVGAASKTAIGLVPEGNTGGSNVSPFLKMKVQPEQAKLIQAARGKRV